MGPKYLIFSPAKITVDFVSVFGAAGADGGGAEGDSFNEDNAMSKKSKKKEPYRGFLKLFIEVIHPRLLTSFLLGIDTLQPEIKKGGSS